MRPTCEFKGGVRCLWAATSKFPRVYYGIVRPTRQTPTKTDSRAFGTSYFGELRRWIGRCDLRRAVTINQCVAVRISCIRGCWDRNYGWSAMVFACNNALCSCRGPRDRRRSTPSLHVKVTSNLERGAEGSSQSGGRTTPAGTAAGPRTAASPWRQSLRALRRTRRRPWRSAASGTALRGRPRSRGP